MMTKKKEKRALAAALAVYTIWGFTFLASKVAQESVTPFVLLAYRFDFSFVLLLLPALFGKEKICIKGKNVFPLLLLGLMEPCLYFIGEQYGVRFTNSAFSGLMIAVIPIVTLLLAALFLKDRPSLAQWGFSVLSIAGIVMITLLEDNSGSINAVGVLCLLMAVITGSSYTVISRSISDEFSVFERTLFMQGMGAVFFTVLAVLENRNNIAAILIPAGNLRFLIAVLFLSVFASAIGYTCFNYAVANAPTAKVVVMCNLTTIISVIAGIVILHEPFRPLSVLAMAAVLAGIWGVQKF